jgi:alkyl sulfatase BDS1-like metallo-beta-lactamase superfamily hydrolase
MSVLACKTAVRFFLASHSDFLAMKQLFSLLIAGTAGLIVGLGLANTETGQSAQQTLQQNLKQAKKAGLETLAASSERLGARELLFIEHPEMIDAIAQGGGFGGDFSRHIGQDIFGRSPEAVADAHKMSRIVEVAPRTWMIYMPIVNAVLLETDEGLVLIDTGYNAAGEPIKRLIESVSDKPLHTIIYTHGHVDHAYGTWALLEDKPNIVAHELLPARFDRYQRMRGSLANYMGQPLASLPATPADLVYPTQTFRDSLTLSIGGEDFILRHHPGETDDQLYVWIPSRKALAAADYYQGFLPNAGNGKRMQRYPEQWAQALREMAAQEPALLLPAHGEAISDAATIKDNFLVLAQALQHIVDQTLAGLNAGKRKDLVYQSIELPAQLANHPTLNEQYVSPKDISKMVIKHYTGWWDDIPSNWSPALLEQQAEEIVHLAGGMQALADRARQLIPRDIKLASHLADWAWYANPQDPIAQQLVIDVYRQRVLEPSTNTMEMLNYIKVMTEARQQQLDAR